MKSRDNIFSTWQNNFSNVRLLLVDVVAFTEYTVNQKALKSLIMADTPRLIVN